MFAKRIGREAGLEARAERGGSSRGGGHQGFRSSEAGSSDEAGGFEEITTILHGVRVG